MMNYTAVPFNLGICKIALPSTTASQLREQNIEPKVYTEGEKNNNARRWKTIDSSAGTCVITHWFFFLKGGRRLDGYSYIFTTP